MSGELATQTPPWPTAIPEGMFSPSAKTGEPVGLAVAVGILENLDPIAARARLAAGIFQALGDPDPAPLVEGHGHRVDDVGLGGDQLDAEARRDGHRRDCLGRRTGAGSGLILAMRDRPPRPARLLLQTGPWGNTVLRTGKSPAAGPTQSSLHASQVVSYVILDASFNS